MSIGVESNAACEKISSRSASFVVTNPAHVGAADIATQTVIAIAGSERCRNRIAMTGLLCRMSLGNGSLRCPLSQCMAAWHRIGKEGISIGIVSPSGAIGAATALGVTAR